LRLALGHPQRRLLATNQEPGYDLQVKVNPDNYDIRVKVVTDG
jgi:hypothetical protein